MNPWVKLCLSVYRGLARAFPHEFWMVYGEDMERLGEDAAPAIYRRHGVFGLGRLLADIAVRLPIEYLAELRQDALYALRTIGQSPGFAAVTILSLALGIGVCATFFTQVQWLFRPIDAARDPQALVALESSVSYPHFERFRDQGAVAASATAFIGPVPFGVAFATSENAKAERIFGHLVSPEYFSTLGVQPAAGRFFDPATEKPGHAPVVVISERLWRTHMNSDPRAVGGSLRLNGRLATIIGISPKGFAGVWSMTPAELFVPVTSGSGLTPELAGDALHRSDLALFRVVLRLAPGVELPAATAALDTLARQLKLETSGARPDEKGRRLRLISAGGVIPFTPEQRATSYVFSSILGGLVLGLACANLANLLLARGSQRRKEIAIRLSVGASRFRLVRQLLTESLMLSLAGGIGGLAFAYWFLAVLVAGARNVSGQAPSEVDYHLNFHSLVFALAIMALAGVGFGLAPALAATRTDLASAMKAGAATPLRGYRRFGLRNLLVGSQVAASLTVLLLTTYLVTGYEKSARADPGFSPAGLYLFQLDPVRDGYSPEQSAALFDKLPDRLASSGVVTLAEGVPLSDLTATPNVRMTAPKGVGQPEQVVNVVRQRIGAGYFAVLGVPLVGGREFIPRDPTATAATPAMVNQTAARELFGGEDPIGRRVREGERNYTIVGVARDIKSGFMMVKPQPTVFLPLDTSPGATVILRGSTGRDAMTDVRAQVAAIDPGLTMFNIRSMRAHLDQMNALVRMSSVFYVCLGVFGLILASIGLAGITAYAVARRRKEIGIRMALGARRAQVLSLVLKEGATLVVVGSLLGFAGAFGASRVLAYATAELARVFASGTDNPALLLGAPLLLVGIALLACYLPARRSARIDPLVALREE